MINQIEVHVPGFHEFCLTELTKNNIILFPTPALKNKVVAEIEKIWLMLDDGKEDVVYMTSSEDSCFLDTAAENVRYLTTTMATLTTGQKFVFTVEPAFLFAAQDLYDVWFVVEREEGITPIALCEFKGSKEDWEKGLEHIYANFVNGRYGCYQQYKGIQKGEYTLCKQTQ